MDEIDAYSNWVCPLSLRKKATQLMTLVCKDTLRGVHLYLRPHLWRRATHFEEA